MDAGVRQGFQDFRAFVNPLVAVRAQLVGEPYLLEQVEQGALVDVEGRRYTDLLSGWGTQAFGHRPPAVEAALIAFLQGGSPSIYPSGISPYAGMLAARLQQRSGYDAAFFASGGSEAVEAALKLARGATGKPRIACIEGAYHGCTFGSVAMMQAGPYRDIFGPHLPMVDALPAGDLAALESALQDPQLAAIVVEPIQVESGMRVPDPAYIARLCEGTGPDGVLLIADEIQTGLGRTGRFLHSDAWPRQPDVVTLGKALGGGAMPLSAMLTRRAIFDRVYGQLTLAEVHASTFSGNSLACVAGIAALDLLDEALIEEVNRKGRLLRAALEEWVAPSPLVAAIRGKGLLLGIDLQAPDHPCYQFDYLGVPELSAQPAIGMMLVHRLYKAGFIGQICGHAWHVLRLQPPYTTPDDNLVACARAIGEALDYLWDLQ